MNRLKNLIKKMKENEINLFYVLNKKNIRYLTGFTGSDSTLLVSPEKIIFITDGRYIEQAKLQIPVEIEIYCWKDALINDVVDLINKSGYKTVYFEANCMNYIDAKNFIEKLQLTVEPVSGIIEELRSIKDKEEIQNIIEAVKIIDKTFMHILNIIRPGLTERKIAAEMEYFMKLNGSEGTSFETIVASGIRSAYAHGEASDKVIELGDIITLDFGALYNGYSSDMTRTIAVGQVNEKLEEIYYLVLQAQEAGLNAITAGIMSKELDSIIREVFKANDMNQYFFHGAGHSIGLDIHEAPFISSKSEVRFEKNMIQTIEPGLYLPGLGGVRIEDDILVQDGKGIILTKSPKRDLIKLPVY